MRIRWVRKRRPHSGSENTLLWVDDDSGHNTRRRRRLAEWLCSQRARERTQARTPATRRPATRSGQEARARTHGERPSTAGCGSWSCRRSGRSTTPSRRHQGNIGREERDLRRSAHSSIWSGLLEIMHTWGTTAARTTMTTWSADPVVQKRMFSYCANLVKKCYVLFDPLKTGSPLT